MLKSNYIQRIQEIENFSKHFSENSLGFRSEFLAGVLEISQYYIDLQKKSFPQNSKLFDYNLLMKNSQIITDIWNQAVRNMDSFYTEFINFAIKNLRFADRICIQMLQTSERYYDMFEGIPQIQRETLIELVKVAKQQNEFIVKENTEKKTFQNQKIKAKNEDLIKDTTKLID